MFIDVVVDKVAWVVSILFLYVLRVGAFWQLTADDSKSATGMCDSVLLTYN